MTPRFSYASILLSISLQYRDTQFANGTQLYRLEQFWRNYFKVIISSPFVPSRYSSFVPRRQFKDNYAQYGVTGWPGVTFMICCLRRNISRKRPTTSTNIQRRQAIKYILMYIRFAVIRGQAGRNHQSFIYNYTIQKILRILVHIKHFKINFVWNPPDSEL